MALPAIVDLLPHRPPMLLVDEVLEHVGLTVRCQTTIREGNPFVRDGEVSSLLAIELFAQSACSLIALLHSSAGASLQSGALLGTRSIVLHEPTLSVGDVLEIRCEERMAIGPAAQIECVLIRAGVTLADGSINVMAGAPPPQASGAS